MAMKRYAIDEILAIREKCEILDSRVKIRLSNLTLELDLFIEKTENGSFIDKLVAEMDLSQHEKNYRKHKNYLRRQRAKGNKKREEVRRTTVTGLTDRAPEIFMKNQARHSLGDFVELSKQFERVISASENRGDGDVALRAQNKKLNGSNIQSRLTSRRSSIDYKSS